MSMNAISFESRLTIMTTDVGSDDLHVGRAQAYAGQRAGDGRSQQRSR